MAPFLNIDLGELAGEAEELYALAHVANLACGGHAGDEASIRRGVELCRRLGASVGAHPSYPDREGFGRRTVPIGLPELERAVRDQCAALDAAALDAGARVAFVKLHGALYHDADRDAALAAAALDGALAALGAGVTVIGPAGGAVEKAALRTGAAYAREGFADRRGREVAPGRFELAPRGEPGAVLDDPAVAAGQARELVAAGHVDTVCVHGDTPGAPAIARTVRGVLDAATGPLDGQPLGDGAVRLARPPGVDAATLVRACRGWPGVTDVVVSEEHLGLTFDPRFPPRDPAAWIARQQLLPGPAPRELTVPVRYDGEDLAEVARACDLTLAELVERHAAESYVVRFCGFQPGFAYLGDVAAALRVPRRASPRVRVPAGAVAIAGRYTAVYPYASPGGWNLLGTAVDVAAIRPGGPHALAPGDAVRFVPAS